MLQYYQFEQNLLRNGIWTKTITTLLVDQREIFAKEFSSDVGAAHIQNDLLYICLLTDFARWKTN